MKKPLKEVISDGMKTHIHQNDPGRTSVDAPTQKHTPGPWIASDRDENYNYPFRTIMKPIDGGGHYRIAQVGYPTSPADTVGADERAANARLIAAAPDLLEAAKKVMMFIESLPYHGMDISTDIQESLRRAIVKAEGGS